MSHPGFDPAFGASGASHSGGTVPDPGATAGSSRYLREDQSWSLPVLASVSATLAANTRITALGDIGSPGLHFTIGPGVFLLLANILCDTGVPSAGYGALEYAVEATFYAPSLGTYYGSTEFNWLYPNPPPDAVSLSMHAVVALGAATDIHIYVAGENLSYFDVLANCTNFVGPSSRFTAIQLA